MHGPYCVSLSLYPLICEHKSPKIQSGSSSYVRPNTIECMSVYISQEMKSNDHYSLQDDVTEKWIRPLKHFHDL